MQPTSHGLRITLLAGVSVVALAAASLNANAADMASSPVLRKAPPPPPAPPSTWSWWVEGGVFNTGGGGVGVPTFKPNWGGEGAIGFDWQAQPLWHVLGQFRYGSASKNKPLNFTNASAGGTTVTVNGSQNLREDHWLVDFGVGRDFGLGNGTMWTLGVRVADLRSKLTSNANFTAKTFTPSIGGHSVASITKGSFAAQEKASFVGAGPRFGVQGDIPLGGQWSIDWLAGAAVLFGERSFQITGNATVGGVPFPFSSSNSDSATIFNADAEAGLSYSINSNLKITASYRFDDYFNALRTLKSATLVGSTLVATTSNSDRSYSGPMLRLTSKF
jgi:opacity protein-like surface antigen